MKEIIKKLFEKWACMHQWEERYSSPVYDYKAKYGLKIPVRIDKILICKLCAKIKKIQL